MNSLQLGEAQWQLTGVGTGELLELLGLHHRASDLDGALGGHGGHLGGSEAKR